MKNMLTLIKNNEKYVKCYTKTMKKWKQFANPTKAFWVAFSLWLSVNILNKSSYNRISFDIFDPFDDFILENMFW